MDLGVASGRSRREVNFMCGSSPPGLKRANHPLFEGGLELGLQPARPQALRHAHLRQGCCQTLGSTPHFFDLPTQRFLSL